MYQTNLYTNTATVCYNCRRVDVVTLIQREGFANIAKEGDVLPIYFISCDVCLALPSVHNPMTAIFPNYIDPRNYTNIIEFLRLRYPYAKASQQWKFSVTALRIKSLSRIRDVSKIIDKSLPASCITIWKEGRPAAINSGLLKSDLPLIQRKSLDYPRVTQEVCPMCFSDLLEAPPVYVEGSSEKASSKTLGMYLNIFYDES
jgi:hypothetical protein